MSLPTNPAGTTPAFGMSLYWKKGSSAKDAINSDRHQLISMERDQVNKWFQESGMIPAYPPAVFIVSDDNFFAFGIGTYRDAQSIRTKGRIVEVGEEMFLLTRPQFDELCAQAQHPVDWHLREDN